ncbi:MAG: DUF4382 domain-containing protein [Bacteroidetes bacterium]|nr:DUF4382 domain-containing protein [Bacteroidota bacterium]
MKNALKIQILAAVVATFSIAACNKTIDGAKMHVRMTDAPAIFQQVNVDVRQVSIHYTDSTTASGGWVNLNTNAGIYDLLTLQNDVTATIAGDSLLPLGQVDQMRLLLGDSNYVMVDSVLVPLKVPSGSQTGIKFNLNTELKTNADVDVVVDFDAGKSIVIQGNGSYLLKPVIKVKSVVEH